MLIFLQKQNLMKKKVKLIVDGSCINNGAENADGAICAILCFEEKLKLVHELQKNIFVLSKHFTGVTNNQMELSAVIYGLNFFVQNFDCEEYSLSIESDSAYVVSGITNWIHNWKKKDWKIKSGEYRANTSLWKELDRLNILVNPEWVKIARNSTILHDLADHLANHLALSQICMPAKQIQSLLQKCKI
jgi:ribonuclease HI